MAQPHTKEMPMASTIQRPPKKEVLTLSIGNISEVNSYGLRPITEQEIRKEAGSLYTCNNFNQFKVLGTKEIIQSDDEFDREQIQESGLAASTPVRADYKKFEKQESRVTNDSAKVF